MAVKLNERAFAHAKELIGDEKVVLDQRDAWREHQPSAEQENEFLREHGFNEYAKWYLGIDEDEHEETKGRYKFPYGDFGNVHRCGVLAAETRAAQNKLYRHRGSSHPSSWVGRAHEAGSRSGAIARGSDVPASRFSHGSKPFPEGSNWRGRSTLRIVRSP